jgi:hypothetical protein
VDPVVIGRELGPYRVLDKLGEGGMGEVYRARDSRLGRDVAIKVLPDAVSADPDRLARFEREARAVAALSHPNILSLYDFDTDGGVTYAVMELLEGETLRERLNGGALPVRKSVENAVQIARGLAAAHAKGLVHRDLKPENVFLLHDGQVKILDFGLARAVSSDTATSETIAGTDPGVVLGTVGYMAPEQVRGEAVEARADLFALGAVLYEMLSGQRAFKRDTPAETMTAILREDPPDFTPRRGDIPPALERIARHCLEKNPAERFQSARDVAFALESLSGSGTATTISAVAPARRRGRWLVWPAAVAARVAAGIVGAFLRPSPRAAPVWLSLAPPHDRFAFYPAPAVSPDGRSIAFWARSPENKVMLWVRNLDAPVARALPGTEITGPEPEPALVEPFWSPDGQRIGFLANLQLRIVPAGGGSPVTVAEALNPRGGSWCDDGRLVFTPTAGGPVFVLPGAGGPPVAVPGTGLDLPLDFPECLPGVLSTRTSRTACMRSRSQAERPNGCQSRTACGSKITRRPPTRLCFSDRMAGGSATSGFSRPGTPPRAFLSTRYFEAVSRLSPDGRWLAYASDESGRVEVYVQPFPAGGRRVAVSTQGGFLPVWRPDGKELYYVTSESKLVAVRIDATGSSIEVPESRVLFTTPRMPGDGVRRQ